MSPDRDDIRVGVYVCHCGGNISDVVDVAAVADAVGKRAGVALSKEYAFMCSDPGQKLIIDDIVANGINRVVVAACSPTLHELTFRTALQRAGLNPYLYEHVNIREQVSWVHKSAKQEATAKAIRLTSAGVEKVLRQDPLEAIQVDAEPHVVVVGGGIAGLRAAITLAGQGLGVTLVEQSDRLGGRVRGLSSVYPTGEKGLDLVQQLVAQVEANPAIAVHLASRVAAVEGYVGNFQVRLATPGGEVEVKAGSIAMATGFRPYEPHPGEMGYGQVPSVVTLPELNGLLADLKPGEPLKVAGRYVQSLAMIHCVGSRQCEGVHEPQPDGKVNDYCSRVCCTAALQSIHQVLDRNPDTQVYDLYKDIRTYGRGHEDLYERASKRGVLFFRYDDEALPTVAPGAPNRITVTDRLTWGEELTIEADLVVLATGTMPNEIGDLVSMMKLPTGADRFLQEVHPKLRPVELANAGVMLAGSCQGPMDIGEACAAAQAAASKAAILLSKRTIQLDPFVATVDEERCTGCDLCLAECSYEGALKVEARADGRRTARVNPAICVGCGACAAVCEPRAVNVAGWSLDQFDAMVDALTEEEAA